MTQNKRSTDMDLKRLVKDLNKKFGSNSIRLGDDIYKLTNYKIPTHSVSLNNALKGGLPCGRFISISGMESAGKSLLCYRALATVQKFYKKEFEVDGITYEKMLTTYEEGAVPMTSALIEIENGSYSTEWGEALGIDNKELVFVQPSGMEHALDIVIALVDAGVDLIVIDSITAMLPTKEIETLQADSVQMGLRAKALNIFFGKLQASNNIRVRNNKLPCTVIGINQIRQSIGMYATEFIAGGKSQLYTMSLDIRLRGGDAIKEGTGTNAKIVGKVVKWALKKNKLGTLANNEYDMYTADTLEFKAGDIDNVKELILLAIENEIIIRRGAYFYFQEEQLSQGKENLIELLKQDKELYNKVLNSLLEQNK